jgi:hypothetical protein
MPRQRLYLRTLFLLLIFAVCGRAQTNQTVVTITRQAPLEILSADGTMTGVTESVIGAKFTLVSTDGSKVTLLDGQGIHYRISLVATDYTPPPPASPAVNPSPQNESTPSASPANSQSVATSAASPPAPPAVPAPTPAAAAAQPTDDHAPENAAPDFGPNVIVFDPSTDPTALQSKCDAIYDQQVKDQFGPNRYAIFFKPGAYAAKVKVGFYTQVYGLGKLPDDVTITGEVRCDADWMNGNATVNFWRGVENLAVVAPDGDMWAVSQAAPMRRVHIKGDLNLFQVVDGRGGWASGGFMADSQIDEKIVPGSQQQWFSRNSQWSTWTNGVWNMVFMGCVSPPDGTWPDKPYTAIEKTPIIAEKPFLYIDGSGNYSVFVPRLRKDSTGVSWADGQPAGDSLPISQFYIAHPDKDTASTINDALAAGKNLLLTPGIYHLDSPLKVTRANTVVLGLGMATLNPQHGTSAMEVADVGGVRIACVLFDAGSISSPVLLQVGEPGNNQSHADNPTILYDIFCRIGGGSPGSAKTAVVINSNDVIGDHAWIWRADHGAGAGWNTNPSTNGLIVNGTNVTYYGLFVEHFQQYDTLWNGENGRVYFYQCEMPYDPPTQDDWKHGGVKGWAGYKVADGVKNHEAWGLGIYCVFNQDNIYCDNAVEAPKNPGVLFHHVMVFRLSGATENSGIGSVINGVGNPATKAAPRSLVLEYPTPE